MYKGQYNLPSVSLMIALALLLTACTWGRRAQQIPMEDAVVNRTIEISVMSFNIRYGTANDGPNRWENRKDRVAAVFHKYRPDVVGVQEALHFQIEELLDGLSAYRKIGVGRDDGETEGEYSAIFYDTTRFAAEEHDTFWFSETPRVPGSTDWGNEITRICTWGRFREKATGTSFYVYNLHLDHQSQYSRERSAG
ncbi:MAG TPA: endonuclease/exonuclease/phosphatase family protein, partial [bacterium]|nr:endonuclease/exonuclease/phosphatase family protein [bacterium]